MASQVSSEQSVNENDDIELRKLREKAKIASIYHSGKEKFQRNPNLSHVVHASLHCFQFMIALSIEIFHHVHHYVNKNLHEKDESVPQLPEERNPIFFVYPICMIASIVFAIMWLFTKIFMKRPQIVLIGCFTAAFLMLLSGIMEMKHVDMYIDLNEVSDEDHFKHPVFIHNFVMSLTSIFCMIIYLIQGWILLDYCRWSKNEESTNNIFNDLQVSDSSADTDTSEIFESREKVSKRESKGKKETRELDSIPTLEKLPSLTSISQTINISVDEEPVILYCCFVDCYNYIRHEYITKRPVHEFQVIHVM
ncbi:uncharacterized protein LOC143346049 [Colletes latitarsis]|uniref:uncharacterized protein LOC143346049 n=1 Tax=Colletes latitarsis TaxID=2605962 RepID=UPI0040359F48